MTHTTLIRTPTARRVALISTAALLFALATTSPLQAQGVYPPGSIFAAGTVNVSPNLLAGNMTGGYFGNGSGHTYDVAVTNATGSGPLLSVYFSNGDGTFSQPTNYTFTGSTIGYGTNLISSGPISGASKVDLVTTSEGGLLFLIPGNGDGTFGTPVSLSQSANTLQTFPNANGTLNLAITSLSFPTPSSVAYSVIVMINDGTGHFTAQTIVNQSSVAINEVDYLNIAGTPTILIPFADGTVETSSYASGAFAAPVPF